MTSQFEELLQSLGKIFELKLHVDRKNACSIQVYPELTVQLQIDPSQEFLWIFAKIASIAPGKFREIILKEALKANALPDPRPAFFGYIHGLNELAQFQKYPLAILNGERLSGMIGAFVAQSSHWQEAIQRGESPAPRG